MSRHWVTRLKVWRPPATACKRMREQDRLPCWLIDQFEAFIVWRQQIYNMEVLESTLGFNSRGRCDQKSRTVASFSPNVYKWKEKFFQCSDFLTQIYCSFRYTIVLPRDRLWGAQDENGTWNGLVKDLKEKVSLLPLIFTVIFLLLAVFDISKTNAGIFGFIFQKSMFFRTVVRSMHTCKCMLLQESTVWK